VVAEQLKLTKMELRSQQLRLSQLRKYLPTLQLKKALLQLEVDKVSHEIAIKESELSVSREKVERYASLFSDEAANDLFAAVSIQTVQKEHENIAGVEIPIFQNVIFAPLGYSFFDTPLWLDSAVLGVKDLIISRERLALLKEQKRLLEKELKEVSIRVNLFEKVLIPKAQANIKKIRIFLGDLQLTAVAQAKVAKRKILQRKGAAL